MNTLKPVTPMDLYEEQRRSAAVKQDDLNTFLTEARGLAGQDNIEGAGKSIPENQKNTEKGAPSGAPFSAVSDAAIADTPSSRTVEEDKAAGWGTKLIQGIDWLASPLTAMSDAGLAPLSHEYKSNSVIGQIGEALSVSKDAFIRRLLPTFGQENKDYGTDAINTYAPNLPEPVKQTLGMLLNIAADPGMGIGIPMAKSIQQGLRVARDVSQGMNVERGFKGILQEGLLDLLSVGKGYDPAELTHIGKLAEKADAGNKEALTKLNALLEKDRRAIEAVDQLDANDVNNMLGRYREVLGDKNAPVFTLDKHIPPEQLLQHGTSEDAKYIDSINYNKINGEEDIKDLITNVSNAFKETMAKARTKITDEEMMKMSRDVNNSLTDLMGRKVSHFEPFEALALRHILVTSALQLRKAGIAAANSTEGIHDLVFDKALAVHQVIQAKVNGVASHASQLFHSFNIEAKESRAQLREINKQIAELGSAGDKRTKQIVSRMLEVMDDPRQINKFVGKLNWQSGTDALFEAFTNSILSGPITHATNMTSNAFVSSMRPVSKVVEGMSAVARLDFQQAKSNFAESIGMMHGILQMVGDGLKLITKKGNIHAIETPEVLNQMHELARQKLRPAITAQELGAKGKLGSVIDALGSGIRLPGNALLEEDRVSKILNYRMTVNAEAAKAAVENGESFADTRAIYNALRGNPDEHIITKAVDDAAYYTFTNQLGETGSRIAQAIRKTPGLRYLLPFFRTPTNIMKMGVRNSFFGSIYDTLKGDMFKLTAKGDVARARLALGTAIPAYLLASVDDDRITGSIDTSTPRGRFLASQNHPEYSIKIGDTWYSYGKIEPLKTILGLVVNANESLHHIELTDPVTQKYNNVSDIEEQIVSAFAAPFVKTVGDNYMLPVIGQIGYIFEGLHSGNTDYALKQFKRVVTSFIPNLSAQYNQQSNLWFSDPVYRQANTMIEMMKAKIPGLSKDLPPRYTLWGDEQQRLPGLGIDLMSPIRTATLEPDKVDKEIERLGVNIPGVPKTISVGPGMPSLDLDNYKQAKFAQARGKGFNGVTLKSTIKDIITDPSYTTIPDKYKKEAIERIMNQATRNTGQYMIATDPDLQKQLNEKIEALQSLQQLQ